MILPKFKIIIKKIKLTTNNTCNITNQLHSENNVPHRVISFIKHCTENSGHTQCFLSTLCLESYCLFLHTGLLYTQ
jgi:hypothetical protein